MFDECIRATPKMIVKKRLKLSYLFATVTVLQLLEQKIFFFFSNLVFPISISPLKELLVFLQVTREYWSSNIQRNEGKNQANKKTGLKCFEEC